MNVRHSISSVWGGVVLNSFCLPIRAISLLKSPHSMCVWFGCELSWCVIFCWIVGMSCVSSICEGMYMWIISHG